MAVLTAAVVGAALGGAAVWSWQGVLVAHHLQSDLCVLDNRQLAELHALGQHPAQLPFPGCP